MKKVLALGLLAICAMAMSQQQASAWINNRFGLGVNWDFQSGGNVAGWGIWRNGQPHAPDHIGHFKQHHYSMPAPHGFAPMPQGFGPTPYGSFDQPMIDPSYASPAAQYVPSYGTPFQFATYPRPVYYYPAPYGR